MHRDVTLSYPKLAEPGQDVVVLLHGLFATAGVLRPLRRSIEREAPALTASLSYAPVRGVASIAEALAELIESLPSGVRVHLVGHSVGGVIARWYVQELGADSRVVQTISLAAPFGGTQRARLMPAAIGRDIRPDSPTLSRLRDRASSDMPHLSVLAELDSLVTGDAAFVLGERAVVRSCGHNGLLYHRETAALVVERVQWSRTWQSGRPEGRTG